MEIFKAFGKGCFCKNCIYKETDNYLDTPDTSWEVQTNNIWCELNGTTMPLDGFCSEGKLNE